MIPKFRAWNIESKEMLEHDFIVETVMWGGNIVRDFSDVINGEDVFILMQSTGLTDKNGKEIFEGDIVQQHSSKYEVKYDLLRGGWYPFATDDGCGCCSDEVAIDDYSEVIGNIHEHPHLLKENTNE